ncbi:kelch-like protein 26 [Glandiceps talaboti]
MAHRDNNVNSASWNSLEELKMPPTRTSITPMDSQPGHVLHRMAEMWRKKQLNDVILAVGKHRFGAHKLVLAACSNYFRRIFADKCEPDMDQFIYNLHGISHRALDVLLQSMYTATLDVDGNMLEELLRASHYLEVTFALRVCCEYMKNELSPESCLKTMALVSNFDLDEIQEATLEMAARHFQTVSRLEDFLQLPQESLRILLSRDDVVVDSETQVFEALVRWLEYDRRQRMVNAVGLLQCVRLPMIKPCDIVDKVEPVTFLTRVPECEDLIKEALHYHCLPLRQSILQSPRTIPRSTIKLSTIVVLGGHPRLSKDNVSDTAMYYNPSIDEWRQFTKMKSPLHHHAVAVLGGFLYVAGGRHTTNVSESPTNTAYRYDPRTDLWIEIASMKSQRESFQLGVLDGMLYAVGGRIDDNVSLADVERYNPFTDQWDNVAPLSDARRSIAVAAHNGRLYAMGGSGNRRVSSKVERYNPRKNKWETKRPLPTSRFFAHLVSMGTKLYLIGGATIDKSGNLQCVSNVDRYDTTTDTWTRLTSMLVPRAEAACTVHDGKIYILGGYSWDSNSWLDSTECYDVQSNEWAVRTPFPKKYTGMACCVLILHKLP